MAQAAQHKRSFPKVFHLLITVLVSSAFTLISPTWYNALNLQVGYSTWLQSSPIGAGNPLYQPFHGSNRTTTVL
jgi:hypothetical protein